MEALSSYPTLFALCIFVGFPVPFPEDIIVMTAGTNVASGQLQFLPTALACGAGMYIRDINAFLVAHHYRDVLVENQHVRKFLGEKTIRRWERVFGRYGALGIFLIRFAIGSRVKLLFIAAALGVRRRTFFIFDFLGMLVVSPLLVWLGYRFGDPVIEGVTSAGPWFTATIIAVIVGYILFKIGLRRMHSKRIAGLLVEEGGDCLEFESDGD
ncbi:MAG: membrane protein DedA with SNARE-associated domain [Bradymonadia bacterium]|jgi:membrane protein DedA with SNARE-associated domain